MVLTSENDVKKASDLDREWLSRRDQFHTVTLQTEIDYYEMSLCIGTYLTFLFCTIKLIWHSDQHIIFFINETR